MPIKRYRQGSLFDYPKRMRLAPYGAGLPMAASMARRLQLQRSRYLAQRSGSRGGTRVQAPVGNRVRRDVVRSVRDMPLYAPMTLARPEQKFSLYTPGVVTPVIAGGVALDIFKSSPGDGASNTIGSRVMMTGVDIRGQIVGSAPGAAIGFFALVVMYDRSPAGVVPPITTMFNADTSLSFEVAGNRDRFQTLARYNFLLAPDTQEADIYDIHLAFRRQRVWINGTDGADIANVTRGGLYLVFLSASAAGTTASFELRCRVQYADA